MSFNYMRSGLPPNLPGVTPKLPPAPPEVLTLPSVADACDQVPPGPAASAASARVRPPQPLRRNINAARQQSLGDADAASRVGDMEQRQLLATPLQTRDSFMDGLDELAAARGTTPIEPSLPSRLGSALSRRSASAASFAASGRQLLRPDATASSFSQTGKVRLGSSVGSSSMTNPCASAARSQAGSSRLARTSTAVSIHAADGAGSSDWNKEEVYMVRSALEDYKKQQARKAGRADPCMPLRMSPMNWGCRPNVVTASQEALQRAPKMTIEPKWSSDIKNMDSKVGERHKWVLKIAGAVNGQMMPEMHWMPPKTHYSNPPTPQPNWPH
eukprot:TRINITY_DN38576_c0_g1_i1.p1 TRINITY_DN38576_c0_g1~~TRINITY_DN38576_c0_g1_i1.p1  ORF type:complete len:329 (-),score=71.01 TRINITY_DN38576_c0_g1_i1:62-1048(-)